jgi:hypothetical protein
MYDLSSYLLNPPLPDAHNCELRIDRWGHSLRCLSSFFSVPVAPLRQNYACIVKDFCKRGPRTGEDSANACCNSIAVILAIIELARAHNPRSLCVGAVREECEAENVSEASAVSHRLQPDLTYPPIRFVYRHHATLDRVSYLR